MKEIRKKGEETVMLKFGNHFQEVISRPFCNDDNDTPLLSSSFIVLYPNKDSLLTHTLIVGVM